MDNMQTTFLVKAKQAILEEIAGASPGMASTITTLSQTIDGLCKGDVYETIFRENIAKLGSATVALHNLMTHGIRSADTPEFDAMVHRAEERVRRGECSIVWITVADAPKDDTLSTEQDDLHTSFCDRPL
jgi:hypothetical protein